MKIMERSQCLSRYINGFSAQSLRWHPLAVCILLCMQPASAADYFDPAFLNVLGESENVDLSSFSESGAVAPGQYTVNVFINQRSVGQFTLDFVRNADDKIAPQLTPAFLKTLGVNVSNLPALKDKPEDEKLDNLAAVIPDAKTDLDLAHLRLDISVPQVAMSAINTSDYNPELWDDGIPAFIANYNVSAGRSTNRSDTGSNTSNNLFFSSRLGANAGPWRLRSNATYSSYKNSVGSSQSQTQFSGTTLSRDIIPLHSSVEIGETYTGSDIFDGISFKGIKLTSNEQMLPSQLRGFAPAITGVANSNARITIRQNGNIIYETYVAQGPFSINDLQQSRLSGNYDVTITEADGTKRQFIVPYSSLPVMLRPGGWKYEVSGGRYNGNLTKGSREADFILASLIYGLPQNLTLYGGTVVSNHYQSASMGTGVSLGSYGAISVDVTHSKAQFDNSDNKTGQSWRLRYSKSLTSTGTTVDLTALRYSTRDYFSFSEYNSHGYQLGSESSPWLLQRRRSSFQTQLRQQLSSWGTIYFRINRDDYWNSDRTLTGASAGFDTTLRGISYGINYNIDRIKDTNNDWPENRQISATVSVPFSIFGPDSNYQSMYATASTTHDNMGRTQNNMGVSGSLAGSSMSYSLAQSFGNNATASKTNANLSWQGSKGTVSGGYSYSNQDQAANINASGGMLVHSGGVIFSGTMGDAMALVSVPDAPNVSVNNRRSITNAQGYALDPYLSTYSRNSIGIDPSTLPEDIDVGQTNINVYPTRGAVVKASFKTRVGYQALMTLKTAQGFVPFGAIAYLVSPQANGENSSIVGDAGQVYLTGLPPVGKLRVKWGEEAHQQCLVAFDLSKLTVNAETALRQVTLNCQPQAMSKPEA